MDIDPNIARQVSGPLGAISAMAFMKDPWPQRLLMVIPGCVLSFYAAGPLATYANMPEGLAGYLVGLLGMAVVKKLFDTWENLKLGDIITKKLSQWLGVKEEKQP